MLHKLGAQLTRLRQRTVSFFVQEVPEDVAVCEFDCRKGKCEQGEWEVCERRLTKGAGEPSPGTRQTH